MILACMGIITYLIICLVWFLNMMGKKFRKDRWYDVPFWPGVMILVWFVVLIRKLNDD